MGYEDLGANTALAKGDRRPVTILFTDIVGSSTHAERLDPEEWREVVTGAHRRVSEAVARYEGTVAQLLGDGVLAFFGAPAAHEDDPARAVQAALDIQAAMADYAHELAGYVDGFAMRIGIHTGEVVVGPLGGEVGSAARGGGAGPTEGASRGGASAHVEYLAIGDAVNLAARLQAAAAPGKVLISASTARLVRGVYELLSLGEITVKGKAAPVAVYEVAGAGRRRGDGGTRGWRDAETRRSGDGEIGNGGGALRVSPLVGRAGELGVLTMAMERLCQGHGAIVALLGEAGIGKSRLVEEARAWAESNCREIRWLEGRALSYGAGLSYWTIGQLIRADLGLSNGDPEVRMRVALRRRLSGLPWERAGGQADGATEVAPYVAHLLGFRLEGEAAGRLEALDSETLKYQLLSSIRRYVAAVAAQQPLVLVCDDVHWADPSSLAALGELLALTDEAPVLLLLVARAEREHGSWRLKVQAETDYPHRYSEIVLRPLPEADAHRLVENLLFSVSPRSHVPVSFLPASLARLLLDRAEGNPFFLEELVASLVEEGALVREEDGWRLTGPVEDLRIPETVQGVLLARIDRLEADVRGTLQMASVIGRSFPYRLLQAVAEPGRPLDRHLVVLQRADLVREEAVRPQLEYIFKHSLAQETAYGSLLLERRRALHRRVSEALEQMYAGREEEILGLLAHHFDQAEEPGRALHYLIAAGDKARLGDALAEAARFYRRAVQRLEAAGDAEGAARAWLKLALVHQADFDHAAAHEAYERGFAWQLRAPRRARRSPDADAVLRRGCRFPFSTLDPGKVAVLHDWLLAQQLFAGLAEIDADLNVVPHAARSWEVLDEGRRCRIYLRDDVRWTDGRPVTAHDYVYAWLRNLDPQVAIIDFPASLLDDVVGARAYRLGQLRDPAQVGIRALDDLTLEVRLEEPLPYLPYLLGLPITFPLPRQVVECWGEVWWQPEHMVCNGPFRPAHFEREHVVIEHNPLYFGMATGNLARAEFVTIPDEAERLARFRRGELDASEFPWAVPGDLESYRQRAPELWTWHVVLLPRPPLEDIRVRRALAMAVNWSALAVRLGGYPATGGLIPPGMPGHTPGLALPYDPEQALSLLEEAGYPGGRGLSPLRLTHGTPEDGAAAAELLREALPVEVDVQLYDLGHWPDDVGAQLIFRRWVADLPDPDSFLRQAGILQILAIAGWQDPELDALLRRAAHATDRADRLALYRLADRRLVAEQVLVVPQGYAGHGVLSQPWVQGARPDKMGHERLRDVVVEKH